MSSVQLNVYGVQDASVGTLVVTVHDPLGEVGSVGFYVTDPSGIRSIRLGHDRMPSAGVFEKDVALDASGETLVEADVALKNGTFLRPAAESFARTLPQMARLQVGANVNVWMHNPYNDEVGAPTAHISRLEVGGRTSVNHDQPAILRIHQEGTGSAEFFKPRGAVLELRETPGGGGTWFNHFRVTGASIQADTHVYAHWTATGRRLRMGDIYGAAGLYTPDSEMKFDIGGAGPFRFTMVNAEKMSLHKNGWMDLQGGLHLSRNGAYGGGIVLADDGDIVDLNDGYCSMRFATGVRVFSANRGGNPVVTLTATGDVYARTLYVSSAYVSTTAGQIRTDLGNSTDILLANTNRGTAMWVGNCDTFTTGPRMGLYGDSNPNRSGQVWFLIGGDANPADPRINVERRTSTAWTFLATLCDGAGNGWWKGGLSATAFTLTSSREAKEEIRPFADDALALINRIGVVSFAYREDEARRRRVGIVAEDTDPLFSGEEQKHFDLANTLGVLVRAVQEIGGRLERLERLEKAA